MYIYIITQKIQLFAKIMSSEMALRYLKKNNNFAELPYNFGGNEYRTISNVFLNELISGTTDETVRKKHIYICIMEIP